MSLALCGTVVASPGASTSASDVTTAAAPNSTGGLRALFAVSQSAFESGGGSIERTAIGLGLAGEWIGWSRSLGVELRGAALAALPVPDESGGIAANHFDATAGLWLRLGGTSLGARLGADFALYYLEEGTYQERTDTRLAPRFSVAGHQRVGEFELSLEAGTADEPFYSLEIGWRAQDLWVLSLGVTRRQAEFDDVSGRLTMWGLTARSGF